MYTKLKGKKKNKKQKKDKHENFYKIEEQF